MSTAVSSKSTPVTPHDFIASTLDHANRWLKTERLDPRIRFSARTEATLLIEGLRTLGYEIVPKSKEPTLSFELLPASVVDLTKGGPFSADVEPLDRAEVLAAIHSENGLEDPRLSGLSWLRDLLRSARNAGAFQALQGDSDDKGAVYDMLLAVEDMYRRLAALTGQRRDIFDSENPQHRGEAA